MTIQLAQIYKNNLYKDDMYVTISDDKELENLLYLKFYSNINTITVELLQTARKEVIRKLLLMEHVNKIIYRNSDGTKEEINSNRKLIVKMPVKNDEDLISDDAIIKFQQILDISNNFAVVQSIDILSDEILNMLQRNEIEYVRIMDFGKNKYTIQQIKDSKTKVGNYIEIAELKDTKTEKFVELYINLYNNLSIDYLGSSDGNICDIIYDRTSLEAVAEILKYILDRMNIENKVIAGKLPNGNVHYWNQVKIDYVWYNVDLGLDISRKSDSTEMKYCLKSDVDFYEDHIALSQNIEICNQNSAYFLAKDIEEKEGFITKLFKKIAKLVIRKKAKRISAGKRALN